MKYQTSQPSVNAARALAIIACVGTTAMALPMLPPAGPSMINGVPYPTLSNLMNYPELFQEQTAQSPPDVLGGRYQLQRTSSGSPMPAYGPAGATAENGNAGGLPLAGPSMINGVPYPTMSNLINYPELFADQTAQSPPDVLGGRYQLQRDSHGFPIPAYGPAGATARNGNGGGLPRAGPSMINGVPYPTTSNLINFPELFAGGSAQSPPDVLGGGRYQLQRTSSGSPMPAYRAPRN